MDYIVEPYRMMSGQGIIQENEHDMYIGKSDKIWLVAKRLNRAQYVYVSGGLGSQGYGGSTMSFKLAHGRGSIALVGPWHSNSDALYNDTGIDVRNENLVFGVIGLSRKIQQHPEYPHATQTVITDVIYKDENQVLGSYNRIRDMAKEMCNEQGRPLMVYFETMGGSSCGLEYPDNWDRQAGCVKTGQ